MDYNTATGSGRIMGHASSGGSLEFYTNASGAGVTPKLYISSSGLVGIGTVSPAVMHHLYSASGGLYTRFEAPQGQVNFGNSNGAGVIHVTSTSQPLRVLVNGANERLRITSDGRVGINQTAPQAMLQVDYDYNSSEIGLRLRAATGSGTKTWQLSEINGNAGVFTLRNASNGYNILNVDGANQRIGINDTAPERTMDVRGSNCMIQLEGTAGNGRQWSLCSTDNATGTGVDGGPSGTFAIYDDTDGIARLRIDSNGNARFIVSGGSFTAEGTGAYGMSIHNHNSPSMGHLFIFGDNGLIRFRNSSSVYTAQMGYTESNNAMFFTNQEGGTTMYILSEGVKINDNEKFLCGNDNDLEIYHNNSNAYIKNGTGQFLYRSQQHVFENAAGSSEQLRISSGGDIGINVNNPGSKLAIYDPDGHNLTLSSHNWSGEARIGFTGGEKTANGTSSNSTAGALGVTASAPGGAAVGYMSFYTNEGDNLKEKVRITHQGNTIFKDKDSGHIGGGFYSRTKTCSGGSTTNFMRFVLTHGALAGSIYATASNNARSISKSLTFAVQYGDGSNVDLHSDSGDMGGTNFSVSCNTSANQHDFRVTVTGSNAIEVNLTLVVGCANQDITYTEL
jgi:hypothetical protein